MNAALVEIMQKSGHTLPEAHHVDSLMRELAYDVEENTGFENFGIPFCMTVEAEALGSPIDFGTLSCEPKIKVEAFQSVKDVQFKPKGTMAKSSRVAAVVQSLHYLSQKYPDIPAIGSLTGPLSTSASIVYPMTFLKQKKKKKEAAHKVIDYVTHHLIEYARLMVDNGATVISIADPTATGEILGPKMFKEYAVFYLNMLTDAIHEMGVPVIIHICGEMAMVKPQIAELHGDAISVDAFVNLKQMKEEYNTLTTMGNLSTYLLEFSNPDTIYKQAKVLLRNNIDIISPACGLSTSTKLQNIQAFTTAIKEE